MIDRHSRVQLLQFELVPAAYSHYVAARAVELARTGVVQALMKGSLHSDELLHAATHVASVAIACQFWRSVKPRALEALFT